MRRVAELRPTCQPNRQRARMTTLAMSDIPRAFLACPLSDHDAQALFERLTEARRHVRSRSLRWIPPGHWHLTLRFFGALRADALDLLDALLRPLAARVGAPTCRWRAPLALPSWPRAGVIAFGIDGGAALEELASAVTATLAPEFGSPDKPFLAHLTVMRLRNPSRRDLAHVRTVFDHVRVDDWPAFTLPGLRLYRSELDPAGARYSVLRDYPFAGTDG